MARSLFQPVLTQNFTSSKSWANKLIGLQLSINLFQYTFMDITISVHKSCVHCRFTLTIKVLQLKTFTEVMVTGLTALPVSMHWCKNVAVRNQTKDLVAKLCQQLVTGSKRRVQRQVKHILMIPQSPLPAYSSLQLSNLLSRSGIYVFNSP